MAVNPKRRKSPGKSFPVRGLRGEKTLLLRFGPKDISRRYLMWLNNPEVVRFSNQRFRKHDVASSRRYLKSFAGTDNLFLSIRERRGKRAIGTMTVHAAMPHGTADVGILIGEISVWGKGFGLDAWKTLISWLLMGCSMRKVTGGTLASNVGMKCIFERSGMHLEATRQAQEIVHKQPTDLLYYARFWDA
jgi:RimJ/RimL family protein N-acetyltransferase